MSTLDYLHFLADAPRVDAFRRAIAARVSPGQLVLDLGTGIGTYAMFAARAGARVLAVEADPVIAVARELAADNGLGERIEFLHGRTDRLEPPERADFLIFEDFSPFLFHPETARILGDVRERWLKPDAGSIPRAIRVMLAPVHCPRTYSGIVPWAADEAYGLNMGRFSHRLLNEMHGACWDEDVLLAEPLEVARIDPLALETFHVDARVSWRMEAESELHGLGLWIDLELADGVIFSNGPRGRSSGWDQMLFPVTEPLCVEAGETVEARVSTLGRSPREPEWWSWRVRAGGEEQEMNTFRSVPLSPARLRQARLDSRPSLTARGRIRRTALELMDGARTLEEIARRLRERFPNELRSDGAAYRAVARELEAEEGGSDAQQTRKLAEASART
jgi:protein arginine N-methyltransferase 1